MFSSDKNSKKFEKTGDNFKPSGGILKTQSNFLKDTD